MMTVSLKKMHYRKLSTKAINYRKYKKLSNGIFLNSLRDVLSNRNPNEENGSIDIFLSTYSKVLKKHAHCKKCTCKAIRQFFYEETSRKRLRRDQS